MKFLITGAGGFVGSFLKERLKQDGEVILIDRVPGKDVVQADITDESIIKKIIELDVDIIYHLAAISSIPYSIKNPKETFKVNVEGAQNLLEAARQSKIKRFIFISSSQVYGIPQKLPMDEGHTINPNNPYATSKAIGELMVRQYQDVYGLKTTIIRPFSMFGPKQDSQYIVPLIINKCLKDKELVLQNPKPVRDFLYIEDAIDAMVLLSKSEKAIGKAFNLGAGAGTSIKELAETIKEIMEYPGEIRFDIEKARKIDIPELISDNKSLKSIGWEPKTGFREGLAKTIKYYKGITD